MGSAAANRRSSALPATGPSRRTPPASLSLPSRPGSTGNTEMASKPHPGSTHGTTTRAPAPASVDAPARTSYVQNCVYLLDWWLVRVEGQEGKVRVAGYTTRNQDAVGHSANRKREARRLFTSDSIATRHDDGTLDTVDGKMISIRGPLNIPQMHQNGFPDEVCKWFKLGFPVEWEKYVNPNMEQKNEHTQSPSKSTEYYIDKFLNSSFINSMGYTSSGNDFNTSKGSTGNTDGPPSQSHSNLSNGTPRFQERTGNNDNLLSKMDAYEDLRNDRMDTPKETSTEPRGRYNRGQANNQHDGVHTDASDSALVSSHTAKIFSDLAEFGTPKSGKTLVHLGTEDALDVPTKEMTPQFGAQGSEGNTIRKLRNGKVFGMSNGVSLKKGYSKRKTMQHEIFNRKMMSNEELRPSADLTSHENVLGFSEIEMSVQAITPVRVNMATIASLEEMNKATKSSGRPKSPETTDPSPNMPLRPPEPASTAGVLSPSFNRAPFSAHLGAAAASSSSPEEHPCVTLVDWWLVRVEGDQRKIAIAGFTEWKKGFTSAAIVKRYEPLTLEDEEGLVVFIDGSLNISRMLENGFSIEICEQFLIGFPYWWKTWDSYMESHLNSSNTSNSRGGSTEFYLRQFQLGNFLKTAGSSLMMKLRKKAKNFSSADMDAFVKSSSSSNETHRFEEYTCSNDISEKEKSAASNDVREGSAGVANKVDNVEAGSIMSSISLERGHVDTECNVCLAPTEKCTTHETFKEATNPNDDMHPDAREQEADKRSAGVANNADNVEAGSIMSNIPQERGHVDTECNVCLAPTEKCTTNETFKEAKNPNDDTHPDAREQEADRRSAGVTNKVDNVEACSIISSISQERGHVDTECNACLAPTEKCTTNETFKEAKNPNDDTHPDAREQEADRSCEGTPVASLKNQCCLESSMHITSNQKAVGPAEKQRYAHEVLRGSTRSPMISSKISYVHESPLTRGKAKSLSILTPESLKMKRTRSGRVVVPPLDQGSQRIVYDSDGLISGVSPVQGSKSVSPARKKKRARWASAERTSMLFCQTSRKNLATS